MHITPSKCPESLLSISHGDISLNFCSGKNLFSSCPVETPLGVDLLLLVTALGQDPDPALRPASLLPALPLLLLHHSVRLLPAAQTEQFPARYFRKKA